jgi:hypothetical protein
MGTSIYVSDTSGNPITNATILCGGCQVSNAGSGLYWVDVNLDPVSGAFTVAAPGKVPTVYNWYTNALTNGRIALEDLQAQESKW